MFLYSCYFQQQTKASTTSTKKNVTNSNTIHQIFNWHTHTVYFFRYDQIQFNSKENNNTRFQCKFKMNDIFFKGKAKRVMRVFHFSFLSFIFIYLFYQDIIQQQQGESKPTQKKTSCERCAEICGDTQTLHDNDIELN